MMVALALVAPSVYERLYVLLVLLPGNAPGRLARVNALGRHEVRFAERVRSFEDVVLLEEQGLALLACDAGCERWNTVLVGDGRGRGGDGGLRRQGISLPGAAAAELYVFDYKDGGLADGEALRRVELAGFAGAGDLHTLGMAWDAALSTVYVVNHAAAGPRVEALVLDLERLVATHARTIENLLLNAPNAVAVVGRRQLYVTNDHRFPARQWRLLSQLETFVAAPTGSVVLVRLPEDSRRPAEARVVARVPFANGIEVFNGSTVAVASTSTAAVQLFARGADDGLALCGRVRLPFLPDNLSRAGRRLLIAGHAHLATLLAFARTRHVCNGGGACRAAQATSWVAEWSEADGLRDLYVDTEYPTSATAVRDDGRRVGIVAGLYAKGILVWRD